MLAVLETLLCLALVASFSAEIPWWAQIPPTALLILPLSPAAEPLAAAIATAAVAIAMWAVIVGETRQQQTMIIYAVLSAAVAPRPRAVISDCQRLTPNSAKFE